MLHPVETAALVISLIALLGAGWSAWGTQRQARAAEEANLLARAASDLARAAEARDQTRQHLEERPDLSVSGKRTKGKPSVVTVAIKNNGPLGYDSVTVSLDLTDEATRRLALGMQVGDGVEAEVDLGELRAGESLVTGLARANVQLGGQAKLAIVVIRGSQRWQTIHYVPISRPTRIVSM